jgi:colanic acid/amylovoran biosynthesis glycosyltransferase
VSAPRKVVVVLSKFPLYDEVFLLRELSALSERVSLFVLSLRPPGDVIVHDEAVPLLPRHLAPHFLLSPRVWLAQLRVLLRKPGAYLRALFLTVRGNLQSPKFLLGNLAFFPKAIFLADWAERSGVTHLHGGWATFPASVAMVASEVSGIPFSFSGHAHDLYLDQTHLAEKLRRARFVTTCTAANRDFLLGLAPDVPAERVVVVHHGVRLAELVATHRDSGGPLELLSVGTLHPHKGFAYLIDALKLLGDRGLDFRCTLVGGGPLREELEQRVRRHGLEDRVRFTGPLRQAELLPLYRRADVFVLVAQSEWHWGIPNVIIEALAAGAAVITTRFGSVEELVRDGETGLLVPGKDHQALADALIRLADDAALRRRLADAGHREVVEHFDLDRTVHAYLERFGAAAPDDAAPAGATRREPLRIAYLIDKLHLAGAQIHLLQLLGGLDRRRFAPRVYCLIRGGPVADKVRALGLEVEVLGMGAIYGFSAWRALPRLVRSLRRHRVQLVHTYLVSANIYGTLAAHLAGVSVAVTSRRDMGFSRNWRLRLVEQWLINPLTDRVTAVCPAVARQVAAERGLSERKVVTIPNGVDLAAHDPALLPREATRQALGLSGDEAALGVVAHLSPVKGHVDLLEATARIVAERPRVRLLVVGDGVLRQPLEARARSLGLDGRVLFTGERHDVAAVLAALDVVVVPSHTEGLSNALLEAMAMGRPVVATAVGGNRDLIEDSLTGLLVPPADPPALAAAVLRLLDQPAEAERLGRNARERVATDFGLDRMIQRYEQLYEDLLHA